MISAPLADIILPPILVFNLSIEFRLSIDFPNWFQVKVVFTWITAITDSIGTTVYVS